MDNKVSEGFLAQILENEKVKESAYNMVAAILDSVKMAVRQLVLGEGEVKKDEFGVVRSNN